MFNVETDMGVVQGESKAPSKSQKDITNEIQAIVRQVRRREEERVCVRRREEERVCR